MQIKCCKCGKDYPAKFYIAEKVNVPIVECPYCGFQHAVEFTPLNQTTDSKKHSIKKLDLGGGPYYALLGGTRILSIDAVTDHSGVDDGNVTNWTKTNEFIIAACIHSGGKDTESSTYKLQWQDNDDGGGYVDLASESGSPELSFTITNTDWNHGDTVATGDQVCDIQGANTRQEGERIKNQSLSDAIDLPDEYQSELWFGVNSDNADDSHVYSFQLYSSTEGAAVGICGATIAIAGAGISYQDTGQGAMAIAGGAKKKTFSSNFGQHAMTITGGQLIRKISVPRMGEYNISIAGTLSTKYIVLQIVGAYAMSIAGTIIRKTSKLGLGAHTMTIDGHAAKKMFQPTGGYALVITGILVAAKSFFKTVGEYAMVIIGSLSTVVTFREIAGTHSMTIAGVLIKKISKYGLGGYAMVITGGLLRKTTQIVGGYAMPIVGTFTKIFRVKQASGGGTVPSIGNLATQFIGGAVEKGNMVFDVVRDVVVNVVKKVLK